MDHNDRWILDGHVPVPCVDLREWGQWFEVHENRRVARTMIGERGIVVSTVFLGLDHNFGESDVPLLFETMIFDTDDEDEYQVRTATWDEAEKAHEVAVQIVEERAGVSRDV